MTRIFKNWEFEEARCCEYCAVLQYYTFDCPKCKMKEAETNLDEELEDIVNWHPNDTAYFKCENCGQEFEIVKVTSWDSADIKMIKKPKKEILKTIISRIPFPKVIRLKIFKKYYMITKIIPAFEFTGKEINLKIKCLPFKFNLMTYEIKN